MTTEEAIRSIFCMNLNRLIQKKNVTQREVADYVGVSYPTMNHWIKGNKVPRMDKIDKLCSFFMCSRSDLLEKTVDPNNQHEEFTDHEINMVHAYRIASDDDKQIVDITLKKYLPPNERPQIENAS
jgi:transcriptional regulator with XRE-family HTH domain